MAQRYYRALILAERLSIKCSRLHRASVKEWSSRRGCRHLNPMSTDDMNGLLMIHCGPYAGRNASDEDGANDGALAVAPAKPKLKRPSLYKVVLLNDDYTPMEFVIDVLEQFFVLNREKATQIMLAVHTQGKGVCGI